jgi:predicted TIM-barrel fold metal-dependent hydrolase
MFTRRKFIGTAGAAATLAAAGCATTQPARKREIVDAQVHLWKASGPDYPWNKGAKPQLPEPMTYERVLPLMDEAGVRRVVIVPPGLNDVNTYALEAALRYPDRFAVMGRIPLEDPKSAALLPAWKKQGNMLGLRLTFNTPATLKWLSDGTADWVWPAAEKNGLPIMFLAFGNVHLFGPIAQRHPGLPLIIDHLGVNAAVAKEGKMAEKIGDAVALAKYPNVSIKMSNLVNSSLEPYPFRDLDVPLKRVYDAFGPQRCHWGTDLTNNMHRATYQQRITHFTEELRFLSEDDKDWIMGRSIRQKIRWT